MQVHHQSLLDVLGNPGIHERSIADLFSGRVSFSGEGPVFPKPLRIMAFTNRCGSNLLADYLRQTGKIGGFHESLNHDTVDTAAERHGIENFPDYVSYLFESMAVDGNFGVKASWDQIAMLGRWKILSMFPGATIIHMRRADVISQAISHCIAHQTKRWTSAQKGIDKKPVYSFAQIEKIVESINFSNSVIPIVARVMGLPLTGVLYEGLTRNAEAVVTNLGKSLSLDLAEWTPKQPKISRQSDAVNSEFLRLFTAEIRAVLQ